MMEGQEDKKPSSQVGRILAEMWLQHRLTILGSMVCTLGLFINTVKCVNDYYNQPIVTKVSYVDSGEVSCLLAFCCAFLVFFKKTYQPHTNGSHDKLFFQK